MSILESSHFAAENLRLRQDVSGLRAALNRMGETNDALRHEVRRLQDRIRLIEMETERHRLAVESAGRVE